MAQYPKTTGALVTVNIRNANKAGGDGRMKLDAQLIEMFDIMLPIAELKTMRSDEVDAWIAKMAEYGQEWCTPDGRLLKCSDYPELFALIGYNYGWSSTNPNGTTTYSFTDNNGASKSLVIYNDLDIDGNALPVSGTPAYFRIPNLAGRFLRCAGTASYVNKWTDTDGTVRQLLTEYKAEMYRGQLDAQRGITGQLENIAAACNPYDAQNGIFRRIAYTGKWEIKWEVPNGGSQFTLIMNSSLDTPHATEDRPISHATSCIFRIR